MHNLIKILEVLNHYANLLLCIVTAIYVVFVYLSLKQSHKQSSLSTVLHVFHMFEIIKNDYNRNEVIHPGTSEVRRGFEGFKMGFCVSNIYVDIIAQSPPNYLASFRFIVTNFSSLLDELNCLDKKNKKTLIPSVISFYTELLQPFIDKILPYTLNEETSKSIKEENVIIFKRVKDKIEKLKK